MGEAKRRKKNLGEDYGKVPSLLILGSEQYEEHLEKLALALEKKFEEIRPSEEKSTETLSSEEDEDLESFDYERAQEVNQQIKQWLEGYLQPYKKKDREKLAMGILNPLYEELEEMREENDEDSLIEWIIEWSLEAINCYSWFKPYLTEVKSQIYAEPLESFYEMILTEGVDKEDVNPFTKMLQKLFSDALELQE